ncbi:hypothetical protein [Chitinimonas taiwanensis]|uniref:Uncharacterized protein n=1 Tax=Chitinimonas taiwanensis DSM 18899 TaxID=1121279 RepID=A0A1K2HD51_9NEIS|nr:hypothetical protein [Chitinimonas taiwanensis]SFZ74752.1 hypothetical protein SAMN02745887_01386 [Chitinimonas taiwanensis DSM 18899]
MELDLSKPGAKDERAKLKQFHAILNDTEVVPEQAYRMATTMFPLICFVNNIVALYLSKNYEVIPIFISRAHRHMVERPAPPNAVAYYALLAKYLRQMTFVLRSYSPISEETLQAYIPVEIFAAGSQELPNDYPNCA